MLSERKFLCSYPEASVPRHFRWNMRPPVAMIRQDHLTVIWGQLDILGDRIVLKSEGWTFGVMTRATFGREENHFGEFAAAPEL